MRESGSDANTGADPANALKQISRAAGLVLDGYTIVVGPGNYQGGVTTSRQGKVPQGVQFIADALGARTGDAPGSVIVDATQFSAGFNLTSSPGTLIDGFEIEGGPDAGIVIKSSSDDSTIQNCVVHDNPGDGIRVQDSARVLVFNNLLYGNGSDGIGIAGTGSGSPDGHVISNTIYGSGAHGIVVGNTKAASPRGFLRNNIVQNSHAENVKVFTDPRSDLGWDEDFSLVYPATYSPCTPTKPSGCTPQLKGANDINTDAQFKKLPTNFHLQLGSLAINAGDNLNPSLTSILRARTTTGQGLDNDGHLDLGYHYLP